MKILFACGAAAMLAGCPAHGGGVRPYPEPKVADIVAKVAARRAALVSFTGASKMDYRLGNDRIKGDVLVMGEPGAHVRFLAQSPAGGSPIAEMACDGQSFAFIDNQHNCQLAGPCDAMSIAQFLHVALEPDDFVAIALGTPPLLDGATGTVTWDAKAGHENVELASAAGKESLVMDLTGGKADVLSAKRMTPDGALVWSVQNKDFTDVKDEAGKTFRVPMRAALQSPADKADLVVEWGDRKYNKQLSPDGWKITIPADLPRCGQPKP
jgi:hypothetical protein